MKTLLMLGDSLVEWGDWTLLLPEMEVLNRGRAGEDVQGLSARLVTEMAHCPPIDHILIMAGTNNLLAGDLFFPAIFRTMLPRLQDLAPGVPVVVNGLFPIQRPEAAERDICQLNAALAETARECRCTFLDPVPDFHRCCSPGRTPCFLADGIHLSDHGYRSWARLIRDTFKSDPP